jgi:hypothetical protein
VRPLPISQLTDHLDIAEHAPEEPRRTAAVARIRIVAFAGLDLVRF